MHRKAGRSGVIRLSAVVLLFAVVGVFCLGAARTASAQEIKYKAVYRDPNFHTNWNDQAVADAVTEFFKAAGYEVLDEPKLRPWLEARIKDRERSVLINSHDTFPDSALDPVGPALLPSANNPIRRYLLAGGRIVNFGDIPFYLHATDINRSEAGWQSGGSTVILGRAAASGTWDRNDIPTITDEGKAWGLTQDIPSIRPTAVTNVDIVLSINEIGQASSWIMKFTNVPGRGEFIRLADKNLEEYEITPEFLADLKRVAEYTPPGTPAGPLDTGLEGLLTLEGKPLVGANVLINDSNGKTVAWSATDKDGRFFAFLLPGEYTVDPNVTPDYGAAPVKVTLTAGKIVSVPPIDMVRFPSISLTKENGFQWLAYLSPDISGEESYADPKADESKFEPWDVTATSGNWTPALLDAKGIPNGNMHGWLRLHVTLPADWGKKFRGDLRLYGFNFNASDETFFNGKSIGKTGRFPEDEGGFLRDADTIRNYRVPAEIVNWEGDNVIAIHGYHDGGTGAFTVARPKLAVTTVSAGEVVITTGVQGSVLMEGQPASAVNVRITDSQGKVTLASTDKDGRFIVELPAGSYKLEIVVGPDYYGDLTANFTVEAGKLTTLPASKLYKFPVIELIKENGFQWLAYLSPDISGEESYADPKADESNFEPWDVTAASGNWTPALLDAKGIPNGNMHGWLRLHITLPADWGKKFRGDLRLYGFNFNASDETFFNGKSIGKTGRFPEDEGGFLRDADTIRNYRVPAEIVNWEGDNVIAIHGYHDGGTGAFTVARPKLAPTTASVKPVVKGDLNGDGKVGIPDATIGLRIAVGLQQATADQLAAGDLNGNGRIEIAEVTQILRAAVGLATL